MLRDIETPVDFVGHDLDEFEICLQRDLDVDLFLFDLPFPEIKNRLKTGWVRARDGRHRLDRLTLPMSFTVLKNEQGVAE